MRARDFLKEDHDIQSVARQFIPFVQEQLGIDELPKIVFLDEPLDGTFGRYHDGEIRVMARGRHIIDALRTLAHELVHWKQDQEGRIKHNSGETGSDEENEANAQAGVIMRDFDQANPRLLAALRESVEPVSLVGEFKQAYEHPEWTYKNIREQVLFLVGDLRSISHWAADWKDNIKSESDLQQWVIANVLPVLKAAGWPQSSTQGMADAIHQVKVNIMHDEGLIKEDELDEEELDEWSDTDADITDILKKKGYKFLNAGVDQAAFVEPGTGWVLKIFGTQGSTKGNKKFSPDHQMFFQWAEFCMSKQDNPFLPKFGGYESFYFKDHTYLQIRQEFLYEVNGHIGELLEAMAEDIEHGVEKYSEFKGTAPLEYGGWVTPALKTLQSQITDSGVSKLFATMVALYKISRQAGYAYDLHHGNFMRREDGTPVIVDPWVMRKDGERFQ